MLKRVREQLALGASQIKLAGGGGIVSMYDPIDVAEYTEREFRAAVEAAENWGTYVAVHAYTPRAIQTALRAGVRSIEHGHLMDEGTAKLIARHGAWLSLQPFVDKGHSPFEEGSSNRDKERKVFEGTDHVYHYAQTHGIQTAWGTDILFDPAATTQQNHMLVQMQRWYKPAEVLKMATCANAQLLALSGARNPYPGLLGVISEGALADLLIVDGDPVSNLQLLSRPEQSLSAIMKGGVFYKNTLA